MARACSRQKGREGPFSIDALRMCKFELYVGSMDIENFGTGYE